MRVSAIIPTLNEADNIGQMVRHLSACGGDALHELLVIDGGSTDDTVKIAEAAGATVLVAPEKGRAAQMNYGAQQSTGELLYFVHADNLPPECYMSEVQKTVAEGYPMGCFRFKFDSPSVWLKINSWFNRFNKLWCRGGDQTLFITRDVFEQLGGYPNDYIIMEEYKLLEQASKQNIPFKIIPKFVLGSVRKYEDNSYLRVQIANFIVFNMYKRGASQQRMARMYKRLLNYR
ncbi:MAG: TIGR04283 family arsenosugar biosynthesis glycosyltransferase [Saprospiraceae bacterium]